MQRLSRSDPAGSPVPGPPFSFPVPKRWAAAVAVLLVAFFFCFFRLYEYPRGIWFDPAYNGLDSLRLMQRGGHVIFFPTNGGRESLFMVLIIPYIWILGTAPYTMRALTAAMGVLHVALLFGFVYDLPGLIPDRSGLMLHWRRLRLWVATLAGLVLATSYWHIVIARRGQRPMLVPLLAVPLFWFFLKGWYTGRRRWFVLAGLVMGLAAYTYGAARLLPVILFLAMLPELFRLITRPSSPPTPPSPREKDNPEVGVTTQTRWSGLILFLLTGFVIFLPIGIYFLGHQAQFSARAGSVMVWQFLDDPNTILAELGRNLTRVLGYFCCAGSQNPTFGLPGLPGINPMLAVFLLMGGIGALLNIGRLPHRLLALWWVIGILPSVLAIEAPHPFRMIVAVAPTAALIGLSPVYLNHWLSGFGPAPDSIPAGQRRDLLHYLPLGMVVLILFGLPETFRAYFVDWEATPEMREINDYAALGIRDAVLERTAAGAVVYLPLDRFNDAPLLYYLGGQFQRQALLSVPEQAGAPVYAIAATADQAGSDWVRLADGTASLLPPLTGTGLKIIQDGFAGTQVEILHAPDGQIAGYAAELKADPGRWVQTSGSELSVSFGPARLVGAVYPDRIDPAETESGLPVLLFWQADRPMRDEYEVLVRLVDDTRQVWSAGDARPTGWVYPTSFWRPGLDTVSDLHTLVPVSDQILPPGRYWLAVSLYDPATGRRLPVEGGGDSPDTLFLGPLKYPLPAPEWEPGGTESVARFGDTIALLQILPDSLAARSGAELEFTLVWQALSRPAADYTVFVHLLDKDGTMLSGSDSQPVAGKYPTGIWSPGELVADPRRLPTLAADDTPIPPGEYRLAIGMYDWTSGQRLAVQTGDGQPASNAEYVPDIPVWVQK